MNTSKKNIFIACSMPVVIALLSNLLIKEVEISIVLTVISCFISAIILNMSRVEEFDINPTFKTVIKQIQILARKSSNYIIGPKKQISLVIGPHMSGKTSLLRENKITLLQEYQKNKSNFGTWWHTKQEIFLEIDTDQQFKAFESTNIPNFWENLVRAIQTRQFLCFNLKNIVLTIPITILHGSNSANLSKSIENIQEILKVIGSRAPNAKVNVVFTNCDKILGFQSFFYDLGEDDRNRLIAIFKNSSNYKTDLKTLAEKWFPELILSMQQHVLKRLRQAHDPLRKFEIKDFPLQIENIVEPCLTLIKHLELILPKKIFGLYLCCNSLSNTIFDFIHEDTQPKAKTTQIAILANNEKNKGYFNNNIFTQINCLKVKVKYSKKDITMICSMTCACIGSLYFCYNIYNNYVSTNKITAQVQQLVTAKGDNAKSSELDKLYMAWEYINKTNNSDNQNIQTEELKQKLGRHYKSYLKSQINSELSKNISRNILELIKNKENFYRELLKIKELENKQLTRSDQTTIINILKQSSEHNYLKQHIKQFVKNNTFKLELEPQVDRAIHDKIDNLSIAEKTLLLLSETDITNNGKIDLDSPIIFNPKQIQKTYDIKIPEACNALTSAHELDETTSALCLENSQSFYLNQFKKYWEDKLKLEASSLDNIDNPMELATYLKNFKLSTKLLLEKISDMNNSLTQLNSNIKIFENIGWEAIIENKDIQENLANMVRLIEGQNKQEYYEEIYRQENLPEKSISVINAKLAETLRPEQKNWLLKINHEFNMITTAETYNYLNEIWQKTVIATYNKKIQNKFPLNDNATEDLSFIDFEQFFGPSGILSTYTKLIEPIRKNTRILNLFNNTNAQAFLTNTKIINNWFDKYSKPRLYLTFVPVELEKNAQKFSLEIGNKKIEISKQSEKTNEFIWPEYGDNLVTIEFENTLGQSSIKNKNGPWAFLQMLNESDLTANNNKKEFIITFKLDSFRAKYHLMLQNGFDIQSYGGIKEFSLNTQL
ncbi:MAG: type VI secretion IcmF C-terminal domain-containing protein [Pseudomonadota bacterium]|nr:type VI secretion IcmF C-terminal domain-containing protein [Pseudomonadota bacterium]